MAEKGINLGSLQTKIITRKCEEKGGFYLPQMEIQLHSVYRNTNTCNKKLYTDLF